MFSRFFGGSSSSKDVSAADQAASSEDLQVAQPPPEVPFRLVTACAAVPADLRGNDVGVSAAARGNVLIATALAPSHAIIVSLLAYDGSAIARHDATDALTLPSRPCRVRARHSAAEAASLCPHCWGSVGFVGGVAARGSTGLIAAVSLSTFVILDFARCRSVLVAGELSSSAPERGVPAFFGRALACPDNSSVVYLAAAPSSTDRTWLQQQQQGAAANDGFESIAEACAVRAIRVSCEPDDSAPIGFDDDDEVTRQDGAEDTSAGKSRWFARWVAPGVVRASATHPFPRVPSATASVAQLVPWTRDATLAFSLVSSTNLADDTVDVHAIVAASLAAGGSYVAAFEPPAAMGRRSAARLSTGPGLLTMCVEELDIGATVIAGWALMSGLTGAAVDAVVQHLAKNKDGSRARTVDIPVIPATWSMSIDCSAIRAPLAPSEPERPPQRHTEEGASEAVSSEAVDHDADTAEDPTAAAPEAPDTAAEKGSADDRDEQLSDRWVAGWRIVRVSQPTVASERLEVWLAGTAVSAANLAVDSKRVLNVFAVADVERPGRVALRDFTDLTALEDPARIPADNGVLAFVGADAADESGIAWMPAKITDVTAPFRFVRAVKSIRDVAVGDGGASMDSTSAQEVIAIEGTTCNLGTAIDAALPFEQNRFQLATAPVPNSEAAFYKLFCPPQKRLGVPPNADGDLPEETPADALKRGSLPLRVAPDTAEVDKGVQSSRGVGAKLRGLFSGGSVAVATGQAPGSGNSKDGGDNGRNGPSIAGLTPELAALLPHRLRAEHVRRALQTAEYLELCRPTTPELRPAPAPVTAPARQQQQQPSAAAAAPPPAEAGDFDAWLNRTVAPTLPSDGARARLVSGLEAKETAPESRVDQYRRQKAARDEANRTKAELAEAQERLAERGERINELGRRTRDMENQAEGFAAAAAQYRKNQESKKWWQL